jgi:hypothetical protein
MVPKLDVPFLYLKINKGDNLWFDILWTWEIQYTKICNMLVHFVNHLSDSWKESPDQKNKLSWYKRHEDPAPPDLPS